MIRNREFDVAELSMSNYLMAKYIGLPFAAIPVFLHRRFRHGFIFLNAAKNIGKPIDLIGKKVGLRNFQATANLWIRGILEHEYKLPHRSIYWFKQDEEEVEWTPPSGLHIERVGAGKNVEKMLVTGELDALIHPELIQPLLSKDPRVTRLFPNYRDLEIDYFRRTGIFPIMHTTAIKQEVVDKYPWVPINLITAFEESKKMSYKRMENPRIVPLAWFRYFLEEQEEILGVDPWAYGLGESNKKNLETLMQYSLEQGLLGKKISLDELFINTAGHS
jgi:4,5-dihydroxyphthalate decarboxylase